MIIGGEHFFSPGFLFRKSKAYVDNLIKEFQPNYKVNFTFGGFYSILAIIDEIKPKMDEASVVLLPSYLCPSILLPFKIRGISYKFYKVDDDLLIDTDYLLSIIDENVKAVFFVDYFGASQLDRLQAVLETLRLKNIAIIQDIVQCLEIKNEFLFGDYIFNSFRKFFPFEGSIILSKKDMNINYAEKRNIFIKPKRIGQLLRYFHIKYNLFSSKLFLKYLHKAEENYHQDGIFKMPKCNIKQLNKYDVQQMSANQKHYSNLLKNLFESLQPRLLQHNNFVPLGFVIKLNKRDFVRMELFAQNIFPPIHWLLNEEFDKPLCEKSIQLSKSILTIPLINLTKEKYNYLSENLIKILK
ncbi:MAG: hypothetical protein WCH34_00180 [Bacteroidota bacterium]